MAMNMILASVFPSWTFIPAQACEAWSPQMRGVLWTAVSSCVGMN